MKVEVVAAPGHGCGCDECGVYEGIVFIEIGNESQPMFFHLCRDHLIQFRGLLKVAFKEYEALRLTTKEGRS